MDLFAKTFDDRYPNDGYGRPFITAELQNGSDFGVRLIASYSGEFEDPIIVTLTSEKAREHAAHLNMLADKAEAAARSLSEAEGKHHQNGRNGSVGSTSLTHRIPRSLSEAEDKAPTTLKQEEA